MGPFVTPGGLPVIHVTSRAAGNRTRSTSTPWTRTTGILQPEWRERMCARIHSSRSEGLQGLLTARNEERCESLLTTRYSTLCRGAENRTRSLRTRSVCTTGILRPDRGLNLGSIRPKHLFLKKASPLRITAHRGGGRGLHHSSSAR